MSRRLPLRDRVALFLGRVVLGVLLVVALWAVLVLAKALLTWIISLAAPVFWLGLALVSLAVLVGSCLAAEEVAW